MNITILTGRLTANPVLKYTENGKARANFSLAVDRIGEGADFINICVWDKQAENCDRYIGKGSKVAVEGRITARSYTKTDGSKATFTEVVASRVEFLDKKGEAKTETVTESILDGMGEMVGTFSYNENDELPF